MDCVLFPFWVSMGFEIHCPSLRPQLAGSSSFLSAPDLPCDSHICLGLEGQWTIIGMPTVMSTFSISRAQTVHLEGHPSAQCGVGHML